MSDINVPVYSPLIENEDLDAINMSSGEAWFGSGQHVKQFEKLVKKLIGNPNRYTVAVNTCTSGIHLSLLLCNVGHSDEVILSSFNFVGVAQAILQTGAKPIFCDVMEDSLCPDPKSVERAISDKTKAIITVDYASNMCDHDAFNKLSKNYGVRIIHDAAHSFGWVYNKKNIGSFGDLCVFSFDPVKNFTCIDGGIIVTNSKKEEKWLIEARTVGQAYDTETFGKNKKMNFKQVNHMGFRYHLSNVHAALGKVQIGKIKIIGQSRRKVCEYYNSEFSDIPEVTPISKTFDNVIPFIYIIKVPSEKRDRFRQFLAINGIETHIHWMPLYYYNLLKNEKVESNKVSSVVGDQIVTIPLHSKMKESAYTKVAKIIKTFFVEKS